MRLFIILPLLTVAFTFMACSNSSESADKDSGSSKNKEVANQLPALKIDPNSVGSLVGTIKFAGEIPPAKNINLGSDAWCKNHHDEKPINESLVVTDGNLANAFVYVSSGLENYRFETPSKKKMVDQRGCIFKPRVIGVEVNQKLTMHNGDPVMHNVHSKPEKNRGKNIALPTKGASRDFTFKQAEIMVPIVCDVHPWMRAFVGVVENPFYAVTDLQGNYKIEGLPNGDYEISIWHEKFGVKVMAVSIESGSTTTASDLSFDGE